MWLTDLATVARSTGLPVIEVAGWRTRGHGPMTDVRTIICHHTAGPATGNYPSLRVVRDGRSDLPGPLAQLGLARDGTVYVIAAGLCYHAGQSRDPSYCNPHSVGIEAEATGTTSWPTRQMDAYVALAATLATHYRVPVSRVLGHKETCAPRGRKSDPNFDMALFRARVRTYQEDDMPTAKEIAKALPTADDIGKAVAGQVVARGVEGTVTLGTALARAQSEAMRISDQLANSAELQYAIFIGDKTAAKQAIERVRARDIHHPGEQS